jgi:hypothetical protein
MAETRSETGVREQTNLHLGPATDMRPQNAGGEAVVRGHERRDVNLRVILITLGIMGITAIVIHVSLWFMMRAYAANPAEALEKAAADARGPQIPPEPRLQISPPSDLADVRREETAALSAYGWADRPAGFARIPIERAMDLLVQRGLPRTPPPAKPGTVVRGGAVSPAPTLPAKPEDVRQLERADLIRDEGRP